MTEVSPRRLTKERENVGVRTRLRPALVGGVLADDGDDAALLRREGWGRNKEFASSTSATDSLDHLASPESTLNCSGLRRLPGLFSRGRGSVDAGEAFEKRRDTLGAVELADFMFRTITTDANKALEVIEEGDTHGVLLLLLEPSVSD